MASYCSAFFFFFNDTATTEIYTLSLHDALPILEVGFERLAEVQEEILWLCEAAHAPVIWATQVLEGMATKGAPSRAEVSDAVMSGRAECVMLNKGPYIVETVRFLNGILERMDAHQSKRRAMMRRLSVSEMR